MSVRDSDPAHASVVAPTVSPVLVLADLKVRYGGIPAVKGISLMVGEGESVGLIGPNGAGKSSTLLAIAGAIPADSGSATFDGEELLGRRPEDIVRLGLSLVPEGRNVFGGLTVLENLRLGAVARRSRGGLAGDIADVTRLFPILGEFADRPAGLLSGGQQQQLAIARALLSKPRMLVLDEPSLGLSPTAIDVVFDALQEIRSNGTTTLIVEQRAEYVIAFCDRTYVLHDGAISLELTPEAAEDESLLTAAYFGS